MLSLLKNSRILWGFKLLWITSHTLFSSASWIKKLVFQDLSPVTLSFSSEFHFFESKRLPGSSMAKWEDHGGQGQGTWMQVCTLWGPGWVTVKEWLTASGSQHCHLKRGWVVVRTILYDIRKMLGNQWKVYSTPVEWTSMSTIIQVLCQAQE